MKIWKYYALTNILAILTITVAFVACGNRNDATHTHQWGAWTVITDPTCTKEGSKTRVCNLDATHIETETIPIDAHVWGEWEVTTTPATCTEDGEGIRICLLCGEADTNNVIPALGHDWGEWTQKNAPTCTIQGLESRSCNRNCGASNEERPVLELGHTPNTETGFCTICDELGYNVGDTGPGGGIIYYKRVSGFTFFTSATDTIGVTAHYLEAAPVDLPSQYERLRWSTETVYQYLDIPTDIPGTGTDIGTGKKNTALILALDSSAPAALACDNYINNGKNDWFLPSRQEMYNLQEYLSLGRGQGWRYWSSSQYDTYNAYHTYFASTGRPGGWQITYDPVFKSNGYYVRAIRAF